MAGTVPEGVKVNLYHQQYPTWGDLAREQVRRKGFLFLDHNELLALLTALTPNARRAFALTCAERLMRWHEALPSEQQRPFTLSWRPVLDAMWNGLRGHEEAAAE